MAINFPFVRAVVNLVVLLVFRRRLLFLFWNFISLFLLVSFLVRVVQIKTDAEALMRKYFFVKKEMSNCVTDGVCPTSRQPNAERVLFSSFFPLFTLPSGRILMCVT
jgi:hypothetical protein